MGVIPLWPYLSILYRKSLAYHPSTRAGLFCKSQMKEVEQNSESNAISVYILYLCFLPDAKTTAFLLQK